MGGRRGRCDVDYERDNDGRVDRNIDQWKCSVRDQIEWE
jgi:hypothetical protein